MSNNNINIPLGATVHTSPSKVNSSFTTHTTTGVIILAFGFALETEGTILVTIVEIV